MRTRSSLKVAKIISVAVFGIDTFLRSPGIDSQLAGRYNPLQATKGVGINSLESIPEPEFLNL
jgi:hypothetical protein